MPRRGFLWLLAVILIACLSMSSAGTDTETYEQARELAKIMRTVREQYYKEVTVDQLFQGAFRGVMETLDPYSQYFEKETFKSFQEDTAGKFGGLGIEITVQDGILTVVSPIKGTPADAAGILSGDRIMKINGKTTEGMSSVDAVKLLRGEIGAPVTLSIRHLTADVDVDITLKRAVIEPAIVIDHIINGGTKIAYIRINSFNEHMVKEFDAAVERAKAAGAQGMVLDLRDNPGGLLDGAVAIVDRFIDDGLIVSVRGRNSERTYRATKSATTWRLPLACIVNIGSASASEIVAAAIKDNKRGLVVGEPSFGKGSVQNIIPLNEDQSEALKLTTAQYFRPSGHAIDRQHSVIPDVEIIMPPAMVLALRMQEREDKMRNGKAPAEDKAVDSDAQTNPPRPVYDAESGTSGMEQERRERLHDIQLDGAVAILRAQIQAAAAVAAAK